MDTSRKTFDGARSPDPAPPSTAPMPASEPPPSAGKHSTEPRRKRGRKRRPKFVL